MNSCGMSFAIDWVEKKGARGYFCAVTETLFEELKRYVGFTDADGAALRAMHPMVAPHFEQVADVFYAQILAHDGARQALAGESQIGRLKKTLVEWMDKLFSGPWDEVYFELRCRIGRVHVRIDLPQQYMFGAMNVVRQALSNIAAEAYAGEPEKRHHAETALDKILDLELAIMLHTYREDLLDKKAKAERLSTFGQLVGSIGHELRNPLGVIESSLFILKGRTTDERARKHADRIGEQVEIASGIIADLLDMIRDRPLKLEELHVAEIIEDAAAQVTALQSIRLVKQNLAELPTVFADRGKLRQVFVNLFINAAQAMESNGTCTVAGVFENGGVEVSVQDTGKGVPEEVRRRLFEPLVTTKAKGIGLGLALCRRIVMQHGGTIEHVPSEKGARFVVRLPVQV